LISHITYTIENMCCNKYLISHITYTIKYLFQYYVLNCVCYMRYQILVTTLCSQLCMLCEISNICYNTMFSIVYVMWDIKYLLQHYVLNCVCYVRYQILVTTLCSQLCMLYEISNTCYNTMFSIVYVIWDTQMRT
jgi:hypothetical protein